METIEIYYENTLHQFETLSSDQILQTVIDKDGNIIFRRVLNAKELLKQLNLLPRKWLSNYHANYFIY